MRPETLSLYQRWLDELAQNEPQMEAFRRDRHTVVIAGPGSGKTRVLALKIAQLLREEIAPPQGVACLTYTRMMAQELERRLVALGVAERPNVFIGTVHSFCLGQVVQPFADVFDLELPKPIRIASTRFQKECRDAAYREVFKVEYDRENDRGFEPDFHTYRRQRADVPLSRWPDHKEIAEAIAEYEKLLMGSGYVDFDMIVQRALHLIMDQSLVRQSLNAKYAWLAVDEYQDLGYPLFRIVTELLNRTAVKLFAIGDPDQAIFDFAGTDPEYLLKLAARTDMKPTIVLQRNYRSTKEIVVTAQAILGQKREQHSEMVGGHCLVRECTGGEMQQAQIAARLVQCYRDAGVPPGEIAVLHRRRGGLVQIADCLSQLSIDFVMDKHPLYDRSLSVIRWLEDLAYWCLKGFAVPDGLGETRSGLGDLLTSWKQLGHTNSSVAYETTDQERAYLTEVLWGLRGEDRFLGDWLPDISERLGLDQLIDQYQDLNPDEAEEYRRLRQLTEPGQPLHRERLSRFANLISSVHLTTLHSSKGTEFDVVVVAGIEQIEANANGRRLLYVGATRARHELCLVYTKHRPTWSRSVFPLLPERIKKLKAEAKSNKWSFFQHQSV